MSFIAVFIFLLFLYCFLLLTYSIGWRKQKKIECPFDFPATLKISVLIPARNEEENIADCLKSILRNHYPKELFEILVIDDFSTDRTKEIAKEILGNQGRVIELKDYLSPEERINSYKKKALELGIREAQGDFIVTTDSDCIVPSEWLLHYAFVQESTNARFIVAPVNFSRNSENSLLYYFQSLDFMTMQGITAASAYLKIGHMCNGANLGFDKSAYLAVDGYQGIDHIASGDDMLLMQKVQKKFPQSVRYLKSENAIVSTSVQPSWSAFFNQRIRWSSKNDKYEDKKLVVVLAFIYLFNLSLLVLFFASFFQPSYFLILILILAGKIVVEMLFLIPVAKFYGKRKELFIFPLLQPPHIVYILIAGFLGKFGKYSWKGRLVH